MEVFVPNFIKNFVISARDIPVDSFSFYTSLLGYFSVAVFFILLFITAYIKIKYRFWSMQPVFHVYDLRYYLFPPGIINNELPEKNKYCNFKNIECLAYSEITKEKKSEFVQFIRSHYLQNKENQYLPEEGNIVPYFERHNATSLFSFYYEDELLLDAKKTELVPTKKCVGAMTIRPIHVTINRKKGTEKLDCYYVDYLCVDSGKRKKGIAPQLIQTMYYHQRRLKENIMISLFKREGELTGIVPLCVYQANGYKLSEWNKPSPLDATIALIECGPTNIHHLLDFMKIKTREKFSICIYSELSNILELIKSGNIFAYMLLKDGEVLCCYFFRKTCTFIKKNEECITLFASILDESLLSTSVFLQGFMNALWKICTGTDFQYAVVENISDNGFIIKSINTTPFLVSPNAYFFYNFAHPTFPPEKVFVLF